MASDTLLRLKVDSTEYEGKIKRAQQGLQALEGRVRELGGTFEYAEKEDIEFTKALGQMETVSKSTSGKIGELRKAFVELSAQYNRLTDEEKKSPFGKALAGSLNQLKGRIKDSEVELKNINGELKDSGMSLESFSEKMTGMGIGALTKYAGATAAASAALKVAGDAFKQNEVVMDEFNRNIEAAKGVYDGFLNALNTGDISGYLQNINNIVKAARDAYDAMDDLGTFNAFNQINAEENRANLSEALANFKSGTGSKTDITNAAKAVKDDLQQRQQYEQNAYESAVNALAEKRGVNADMLKEALSGKYGAYQNLKATKLTGTETVYYSGGMFGGGGSYQKAVATNEQEKLGEMLRKLTDDELQSLQSIGAQAKRTAREIADVDKQVARYMKEGSGGSGGGKGGTAKPDNPAVEGTIRYYQEMISGLNKQVGDAVDADVRDQLNNTIRIAKEELNRLQTGDDTWRVTTASITDTKTAGSMLESAALNIDTSSVTKAANDLQNFNDKWANLQDQIKNNAIDSTISAFNSLGNAIGGTEGQIIKLIAAMAQQVISGVSMITSLTAQATAAKADATAQTLDASAKTMNAHSWIPFVGVAMGVGMVATLVSTLTSLPKYATGGIVGGNDNSDKTLVRVSSGELILNRAQQDSIASQLQQGNSYNNLSATIKGEDLIMAINNTLSRRGRGELATTR